MPFVDASHYQHPLDRQYLQSLQSVPGFSAVTGAYLKVFKGTSLYNINCATNVKISEKQLPEIYDLLPPICDRLGIKVPHLFLANEPTINANTFNEADPFIVINAGLLEQCSMDVVRCTIAQQCGHIASHHILYRTVGNLLLKGALSVLPGVAALLSLGLQVAYLYWLRASAYTADRAAALALGECETVVSMCRNFAGGWDNLDLNINTEAFMEQAADYEQTINSSMVNKAFEILMYNMSMDSPLNAYRALEIKRWCAAPEFQNMLDFIDGKNVQNASLEQPSGAVEPIVAMSFCPNCGSQVSTGDKFCKGCGKPLC